MGRGQLGGLGREVVWVGVGGPEVDRGVAQWVAQGVAQEMAQGMARGMAQWVLPG